MLYKELMSFTHTFLISKYLSAKHNKNRIIVKSDVSFSLSLSQKVLRCLNNPKERNIRYFNQLARIITIVCKWQKFSEFSKYRGFAKN
jgi:hypothetical protein